MRILSIFVVGAFFRLHQRIWIQHKILRFFDTRIDIFQEKLFWVIIALFTILKCKCEKNCTFSNIVQKVKSYCFDNIYHSPFDSYWNSKKRIKLKPPSVQTSHKNNRMGGDAKKYFKKLKKTIQLHSVA